MKLFSLFSLIFLLSLPSFANSGHFGLGIILNRPTGFSGKYRLSENRSIDGALGYSFGHSDNLSIHSTYLWEHPGKLKIDSVALGYYFGAGGALFFRDTNESPPPWAEDDPNDSFGFAFRGSAGLNYYFSDPTFEIFLEGSLSFFFIPSTEIDINLALGARYFF